MTPSCILWQNVNKTTVLLDLPASIQEAQFLSDHLTPLGDDLGIDSPPKPRALVSALPPTEPFSTPEPKTVDSGQPTSPAAQVAELMTLAAVESALEEIIQESYNGPWCLPRYDQPKPSRAAAREHVQPGLLKHAATTPTTVNPGLVSTSSSSSSGLEQYYIPPGSHFLRGTISSERDNFLSIAPEFDLVTLDPPWPNRSAKRKRGQGSYQTVPDLDATRNLLLQIPIASRLSSDGLVAVWVTNAARFTDLLTSPRGVFSEWDVELVGEWTWLKVTTHGEPIVSLDSCWRKPWERLLIARKRGSSKTRSIQGKVIVAVPDVHSRKPSLRSLFEEFLPPGYKALEVFARNLTAGWWAWGNEVLLFQHKDHWREPDTEEAESETQGE
ncbi:MT-A70-domain-containing protein [Podospora australis]|uniref:MT-A70-domain-containing protein n=1 Tax=Podospora australis TaxID=1536484 RepID=A0AAN6X5F9_9PEZI|nr:MT-A70-domain-containing protein [Podospora australis]